jgi:hypothetical protein
MKVLKKISNFPNDVKLNQTFGSKNLESRLPKAIGIEGINRGG